LRKSKSSKTKTIAFCVFVAVSLIVSVIFLNLPREKDGPAPEVSPSPEASAEPPQIDPPEVAPMDENPPEQGGDIHIGAGDETPPSGNDPPEKIALNKNELSLTQGNTYTFRTSFSPETAARDVTWASSDTKTATVAEDGTVTAIAAGRATITAQTPNGKADQCAITVKDPTKN